MKIPATDPYRWPEDIPIPKSISAGLYYDDSNREIAHGIKAGDPVSIKVAAGQIASKLKGYAPSKTVIVPLPSHTGRANVTKDLAQAVANVHGSTVRDVLEMKPMGSSRYAQKQADMIPQPIQMFQREVRPSQDTHIILLDNTIDTGATAFAAISQLPDAILASHSISPEWDQRLMQQKRSYYGHTNEHEMIDKAYRVGTLVLAPRSRGERIYQKMVLADGTPLLVEQVQRQGTDGNAYFATAHLATQKGLEQAGALSFQISSQGLYFDDCLGKYNAIQIDEGHRRKGIASALVESCLDHAGIHGIHAPHPALTSRDMEGLLAHLGKQIPVLSPYQEYAR
jgi:predicted amidophosphoribosyltransferase